ncbi:MAG: hypothetical protein DI551_01450 [Micavibrio aeruginosavorus]|uniref:PepSY domain-containing protein n=1 Tax=Micavibrio aeruginosavorus TaxID=349221 RepID=A0A2W5N4V7_9BACT|nr:MAG: hypothetical protein DI551_01450 [Micavibrio aeruginosavorus]
MMLRRALTASFIPFALVAAPASAKDEKQRTEISIKAIDCPLTVSYVVCQQTARDIAASQTGKEKFIIAARYLSEDGYIINLYAPNGNRMRIKPEEFHILPNQPNAPDWNTPQP